MYAPMPARERPNTLFQHRSASGASAASTACRASSRPRRRDAAQHLERPPHRRRGERAPRASWRVARARRRERVAARGGRRSREHDERRLAAPRRSRASAARSRCARYARRDEHSHAISSWIACEPHSSASAPTRLAARLGASLIFAITSSSFAPESSRASACRRRARTARRSPSPSRTPPRSSASRSRARSTPARCACPASSRSVLSNWPALPCGVDDRDAAADREPLRELLGARVAALELGGRLARSRRRATPGFMPADEELHDRALELVVAELRAQRAIDPRRDRARRADARVDRARVVVGAAYGSSPPRIHFAAAYSPSRSTCVHDRVDRSGLAHELGRHHLGARAVLAPWSRARTADRSRTRRGARDRGDRPTPRADRRARRGTAW